MKKIILFLMMWSVLMPAAVRAADVSPELNPICWHKTMCDDYRKKIDNTAKPGDGWLKGEAPCSGDWGKCLPTGKTVTEISFGGKNEFENIGEFLKTNYNLAIALAGILAVIMIIVAGIQWTTSGGNSEMISSAKKRIGGALVGLVIAYLSYSILNTINPALTNLRLPQSFLIRPIELVLGNNCVDLEKPWKLAKVKDKNESPAEANYTITPFKEIDNKDLCSNPDKYIAKLINPLREDLTDCGQMYKILDGNGATCMGGANCPDGLVCKADGCKQLVEGGDVKNGIAGKITYDSTKKISNVYVYAYCDNQTFKELDSKHIGSKESYSITEGKFITEAQSYSFSKDELASAVDFCGGEDNIDGYFLFLEVNDTDGMLAKNDGWLGGLSFCKNISGGPSCGAYGISNEDDLEDSELKTVGSNLGLLGQLIPQKYVGKGFTCDLDIKTTVVPNLGKGALQSFGALGLWASLGKGVVKQAEKSGVLSLSNAISGVNYNCPAFDLAATQYTAKKDKAVCKCFPEKCNK